MHSEGCVDLEAEKEEDTESEVRLGNDQQPIKLQNSQILNYLSTKLSHLALQHILSWQWLLAGTFNPVSSRNFRVCNTKRFVSVQGHAVWNEKCAAIFQRMVNNLV